MRWDHPHTLGFRPPPDTFWWEDKCTMCSRCCLTLFYKLGTFHIRCLFGNRNRGLLPSHTPHFGHSQCLCRFYHILQMFIINCYIHIQINSVYLLEKPYARFVLTHTIVRTRNAFIVLSPATSTQYLLPNMVR